MNTDRILSIAAILISVLVLVVSISEVRVMRSTQKASAWPYVEILFNYDEESFEMEVRNTGLGPAKLHQMTFTLPDTSFHEPGFRIWLRELLGQGTGITWSTVEHRVLPPGERITFFSIQDSLATAKLKGINQVPDFELCYCSVYEDCWITKGLSVQPSRKCR